MDGNRRYAKSKGLYASIGHYFGSQTLIKAVEVCISLNIKILSVFSLSLLNYNRHPQEIYFLFYLNLFYLSNEQFFNDFIKNNRIRIKICGNLSYINDSYRKIINDIEQKTKEFDNLTLNIFFSYTSKNEMSLCAFSPTLYFDTYKNLLKEKNILYTIYPSNYNNETSDDELDTSEPLTDVKQKDLQNYETECICKKKTYLNGEHLIILDYYKKLLTGNLPPPNILIRTSGEQRLSDFMLYQISEFTEIYFVTDFWPIFNFLQFIYVILHYTIFQTTKLSFSYSYPCTH